MAKNKTIKAPEGYTAVPHVSTTCDECGKSNIAEDGSWEPVYWRLATVKEIKGFEKSEILCKECVEKK